jgi:hypothetical protein
MSPTTVRRREDRCVVDVHALYVRFHARRHEFLCLLLRNEVPGRGAVGALCANADANPESGIQMRPLLMRDEEFGQVTTAETGQKNPVQVDQEKSLRIGNASQ